MERKSKPTSVQSSEEQISAGETKGAVDVMSVAQIQGLVQLLDRSDVSELEIKRASEGVHLVLRKVKASDGAVAVSEVARVASGSGAAPAEATVAESQHTVVAALVGVFHPWLKPRGGTLVAVGDSVKVGQVVGSIESLNVFNEVEVTRAGRVVEVHVQDGQPVEYGQALVTLDYSEVEEA